MGIVGMPLTHFRPMFYFYTPRKTFGYQGIQKLNIWRKWIKESLLTRKSFGIVKQY